MLGSSQLHVQIRDASRVLSSSAAIALLRAELAYDRADPDAVAAFARAALAHMAEDEHGPRLFARSLGFHEL